MSHFSKGQIVYVNGDMDGRYFDDTKCEIRMVERGSIRVKILDFSSMRNNDCDDPEWHVLPFMVTAEPLNEKDLEPFGICSFWKAHGL